MNTSTRIEPKKKNQTILVAVAVSSKKDRIIEVPSTKRIASAKNVDPSKENIIAPKTLRNIRVAEVFGENIGGVNEITKEKLVPKSKSKVLRAEDFEDNDASHRTANDKPKKIVSKKQASPVKKCKSLDEDFLIETSTTKVPSHKKKIAVIKENVPDLKGTKDSKSSDDDDSSSSSEIKIKAALRPQAKPSINTDLKDRSIQEAMGDEFDMLSELSLNESSSSSDESTMEDESMSDVEYKTRLFLGEANFSYTRALLKKHEKRHPNLAKSIIATAYEKKTDLIDTYGDSFVENIDAIRCTDTKIFYNVDATEIEHSKSVKDRRIKRIHFNFPHDKSNYKDQTLPLMIRDFFKSASKIQEVGDRVHVALPAPLDPEKRKFYEGYVYHIYDASRQARYNLIKKRQFGSDRYPGYKHMETGVNTSAAVAEEAREYIFEKQAKNASYKKPVTRYIYYVTRNCLPEIDTDSDSSSYEDNDSSYDQ